MPDSTEVNLRKTLAQIDDLRKRASIAEKMHTNWMYHDGELAVDQTTTVKRRWRSSKTVHSEWVMDVEERELFRDFLVQRRRDLSQAADALAATLATLSAETEQENKR